MNNAKLFKRLGFLAAATFMVVGQAWAQSQPALQETQKSARQRRDEANQRLNELLGKGILDGATRMDIGSPDPAPKAANRSSSVSYVLPTGAAATPWAAGPSFSPMALTPTPTGINPLVDVTLSNYANSPNIRKFVDSLPGLGSAGANNLGSYISIGVPDTTSYPGSDYYEIGLVRYTQRLHSDLPATDLRSYVQLETAVNAATSKHIALTYPDGTPILSNGAQVYAYDKPMYLGTTLVAQKNRAVRVKFTNFLPLGAAGNLPLPMDTTIMGDGMGPFGMTPPVGGMLYSQNRATLHLHGGLTPWISDGTPHQWTCPAGEVTSYPKGVCVSNVPDMPDPGAGSITFYYTNQQSARLMFYHDHAYGITRLNVYAGEAAGYVLTDQVETDLIAGTNVSGGNPAAKPILPGIGIPLVIQDKTFVNDATTPPGVGFAGTPTPATAAVDPLWYNYVPGSTGGNLWLPHEYMPNENIYDPRGYNDKGRWDYAPWMIPPMLALNNTLPSPTIVPEAFMDTPIVNGTPYPHLDLPAQLVRFRILNACNDRMLNLQLYKADPAGFAVTDATGTWGTEVKMVPAAPTAGFPATWPKDGRDGGVPDPATVGPDFWQIGNECGFLANVNVIHQQPVDYDYNRRSVTFGGVTSKCLQMPPAVRADVVVDLSSYPVGSTLILYNDNPAPMPLYDSRYDYYTGDPDQTAIGGAPTTAPGYGPNTRTIMQIRITAAGTPPSATYLTDLQAALPAAFKAGSDVPLVPESNFNTAYGTANPDIFAKAVDDTLNVTGAPQPVSQVVTTLPGIGYTTPPTVNFYGGGGTGASATATLNGIGGITLVTAGTGYTSVPAVTITAAPGDTGVGATAAATISGGVVTVISVVNPGSNYLVAPTVTITGGGGTGATATATNQLGTVGAINLISGGSGYTSAPLVYLTGGGGTGAGASARLTGDLVMDGKNLTEGFDMDYGRMNAVLGSTPNPLTPTVGAGPVVGAAFYIDPPTEILTPNTTYLWRLSHIGVDSHAIHFHLFNVQVINRVDWTNTIKPPYPDEVGWKETIRTNPFEDIIVALRPSAAAMKLPFGIPESNRLLDPTMPAGATGNFLPVAPPIGLPAVAQTTNVMTNFGWEYVWHCHLLGHEENDMMRPIVFQVPSTAPAASTLTAALTGTGPVNLAWTDPTPFNYATGLPVTTLGNPRNEVGFRIMRATVTNGTTGAYSQIGTALANATAYTDSTAVTGTSYRYRVVSWNAAGTAQSNTATPGNPPAAPTNLTLGTITENSIRMTWTDNANNEQGFYAERSQDAGATWTRVATMPANQTSGTDTPLASLTTYSYRVQAYNQYGTSAYTNVITATTLAPTAPAAPTGLRTTSVTATAVALSWTDNSNNETGFRVERATDSAFTLNKTTMATAANVRTLNDATVVAGTTYYYRVFATNAVGDSLPSNVITVPVASPPAAPSAITASAVNAGTTDTVTLNWTDNSNNETGFRIQRATNSTFTGGSLVTSTVGANVITFVQTGRARNTNYYYRVQSYNASGASAYVNVTPFPILTP